MTTTIADIHRALVDVGLVPESERVHFGACSTDYRIKLDCAITTALGMSVEDVAHSIVFAETLKYELHDAERTAKELSLRVSFLEKECARWKERAEKLEKKPSEPRETA